MIINGVYSSLSPLFQFYLAPRNYGAKTSPARGIKGVELNIYSYGLSLYSAVLCPHCTEPEPEPEPEPRRQPTKQPQEVVMDVFVALSWPRRSS